MVETLAALVFAHVLADYVFQTRWMVTHKAKTWVLGLHGLIHGATAWAVLGGSAPLMIVTLVWVHIAIDQAKIALMRPGALGYAMDQLAHLATLLVLSLLVPDAFANGLWAGTEPLVPALYITTAGALFATLGGGHWVKALISPILAANPKLANQIAKTGIRDAGAMIGQMERALCFAAVVSGQIAGVAVLVAAKSVLRFAETSKSRQLTEYVLIGTLASVGWAVLTGGAARLMIHAIVPTATLARLFP